MFTFSRMRNTTKKCEKLIKTRFFSSRKQNIALKKSYQVLGVSENCEDENLRLAFVHLAKKFHPDSGTPEADSNRFAEIEKAYRDIRRSRSTETENEKEIPDFDIKHTAPQHRHYLSNNAGIGTPSERQRRYAIERAQKAAEHVMEHKIEKLHVTDEKSLVEKDKSRAKDIKTGFGMDRLVEDLIQEAMSKGEFQDLPGSGKPLKNDPSTHNPYIDFITYKLNEVLIKNGFTPEWIRLSKEIKEEIEDLEGKLTQARNNLNDSLDAPSRESWKRIIFTNYNETVKNINAKIDRYNFLVPIIQKQRFKIDLEKMAEQMLSKPRDKTIKKRETPEKSRISENNQFLGTLFTFETRKS